MNLINIPSINNLEQVRNQEAFLALTHLVKKYPAYKAWVKNYSSKGGYVILDNGLIETGKASSIEEICNLATEIKADEIILPDAYRDCDRTIDLVKKALGWISKTYSEMPFRIMAVAQGISKEDIYRCINYYNEDNRISVIGIPKHLAQLEDGAGRPAFEECWEDTSKIVHLLGVWYSFTELLQYRHPEKIRSVDTGLINILAENRMHVFELRGDHKIDLENGWITPEVFTVYQDMLSSLMRLVNNNERAEELKDE